MITNLRMDLRFKLYSASPQVPLVRSRLTSRNKLWCTSPCTRRDARDPYTCR